MNLSNRKYEIDARFDQIPQRWNTTYTDKIFIKLYRSKPGWVVPLLWKALT